ncbi:MAG: hypothetical protein RM022_009425 [Nostoc sp. EfeVER01]|uniref:hypothetical protein n=1 Tax=unclassified Nostoc TaxID=2593658 RepID=UPI002AD5743F|nr:MULTISPECIES: hypothetical protein [unclassified Nostoc]MDZ7948476.1 hypothetical protein [Nostoc sp. EfeVER01]MDZ7991790.1 hypothetical protein [Nostoc sp. EspVER01]
MEPITFTATTIATVFFSEAVKEGGKSLGTGVSKMVSQLITTVRNKFKAAGTEGLLTRAEKQPTEANVNLVKAELAAQMEEDAGFAAELNDLLAQLQASDVVRQMIFRGIEVSGNLEAENITQKASRASSVEQEMFTDVKAQNIRLGNLSQES